MDIPSLLVLRGRPLSELVGGFEKRWGTRPTAIAIPALEPSGLLVAVEGLAAPMSDLANLSPEYPDFGSIAAAITAEGYDLVLTMRPDFDFLPVESLQITNIIGTSAAQFCIGNSRAREVAAAVLGSALDVALENSSSYTGSVRGIAIDASNLWPMSGDGNRILANCFCKACQRYFDAVTPGLVTKLRTFPNPLSLCLAVRDRGISFISEFGPRVTPEELVGLAKQRQYDRVFQGHSENDLVDVAADLLQYIRARHDQTVASVLDVLAQAAEGVDERPDFILISEGEQYGWTSGLLLEELDGAPGSENNPFSEIWFNPTSEVPGLPRARYRSYMWRRGRYNVGDLFDFAGTLANQRSRHTTGLSRYRVPEARQELAYRAARTGALSIGGEALVGLGPPVESDDSRAVGRIGLVGVALDDDVLAEVVRRAKILPGPRDTMPAGVEDTDVALKNPLPD